MEALPLMANSWQGRMQAGTAVCLKSRADIPKHSGMSAADRQRVAERFR
jgi:hypothetical protein